MAASQARKPPTRTSARVGTRANPVVLDETPEPEEQPVVPTAATRRTKRPPVPRVRAAAVVKPKTSKTPSKRKIDAEPAAALTPKKKRGPAEKRDCSICASSKSISYSFRLNDADGVCEHFKNICGACIQGMLKGKISDRKLDNADLACPFTCECVLDQDLIRRSLTSKSFFEIYSNALAKHHLASNPNYIACLSSECGQYFSIEDCAGKKPRGKGKTTANKNIACPYCNFELCLTCNRPWHDGPCSAAKQAEDEKSVAEMRAMGAKPCPKCGINIDKDGGCDHMTCNTCRHNFCWQCLVPYDANVRHAEGCPHGRVGVAVEAGNWVQDNLNEDQINRLIARAHGVNGPRAAGVPFPMPILQHAGLGAGGQGQGGGFQQFLFGAIPLGGMFNAFMGGENGAGNGVQ